MVLTTNPSYESPTSPDQISFSQIRILEACPLRWHLQYARYPDLWTGFGYPSEFSIPAFRGQVLHRSIERILKSFSKGGCESVSSEEAIKILVELGGFKKIITESIDKESEHWSNNPRAENKVHFAKDWLEESAIELREALKSVLSKTKVVSTDDRSAFDPQSHSDSRSHEITHGTYSEITVSSEQLGWKGIIDLLVLDSQYCAITDFKSGDQKAEHQDQVRTYALIWENDEQRNPGKRPVTQLSLLYPSGEVSVSVPSESEKRQLSDRLKERAMSATRSVEVGLPEARVSDENCPQCSVRHLCDEYWQSFDEETEFARNSLPEVDQADAVDLEGKVTKRLGDGLLEIHILRSSIRKTGKAILHLLNGSEYRNHELRVGSRVRILSVSLEDDAEANSTLVIIPRWYSEMFYVDN